jgi:hypothetical protein
MLASKDKFEDPRQKIFEKAMKGEASEQELLVAGILPDEKKVS